MRHNIRKESLVEMYSPAVLSWNQVAFHRCALILLSGACVNNNWHSGARERLVVPLRWWLALRSERCIRLWLWPVVRLPEGPPAAGGVTRWMLLTVCASIRDRNPRITARGKANDCHGRRKPICRNRGREAWSQNLPLRPSVRSLNKGDTRLRRVSPKSCFKSQRTVCILMYATSVTCSYQRWR